MYRLLCIVLVFCFVSNFEIHAQTAVKMDTTENPEYEMVKGFHVGIVQIVFAVNKGNLTLLDKRDFYSIGFPMGISLNTHGKLIFDLEFVPVIKPFVNSNLPYDVHLLLHPGILYPLGNGWTFGFRLAFEIGAGQFGFTPLINKAFKISEHFVFFLELVAPGRFGPDKNSGYTQLAGLHVGFGF